MLLTSLYFSRGDRSPLDTPSVPEKPPGIPPSRPHGGRGRAAPARAEVRKSGTRPDFLGDFYAALCGAPVLPVLPKAKCGRRKRAKRAKGTPSACLSLSIKSVFAPKQQSRGSAHSKAFAAQTHKPVGLYPQKYLMRATGGVYLGFHTLRGRKFPYGNFRTSVFCEVKTQIVGKTIVFRQSRLSPLFPDIINILRRETK